MKNLAEVGTHLGQRAVYRAIREVVDMLAEPTSVPREPARFGRACAALEIVFEQCPKERVFSPYIKNQLSKPKWLLLEDHYADWEKQRAEASA
jgi:hypothetical protein